jgi:tRNA1Val (adenine37-N6)-methyltransferase
MKVGTDGVLLGAWCPVDSRANSSKSFKGFKVLDVGTGSGLIALMLAQRLPEAQISAIDIDSGAVEQAKYNFSVSPFFTPRNNLVKQRFRHFVIVNKVKTSKSYGVSIPFFIVSVVDKPAYSPNYLAVFKC